MNDAVAIILFKVVGDIFVDDSSTSVVSNVSTMLTNVDKSSVSIIFGIIGGFLINVLTSLAIGTASGIKFR